MATFDEHGNVYIKLDASGEKNNYDRAWDDGDCGRVKQILIWHDQRKCLSGIQTIYEKTGEKKIRLISKKHGGTQGNFEMITLRKPLTWVSGHYGEYCIDPEIIGFEEDDTSWNYHKVITSLKFGNQEETYGPFGAEKGYPFFYRGGTEIVGFHGFSSDVTDNRFGYISTIGLYITTGAVGVVGEPSTRKDCSQDTIENENKPELISGK